MAEAPVRVERDGAVAVVRLNRPEVKNALNRATWDELAAAMGRLADDAGVGAVVITGVGDAFASGGDVREFLALTEDPAAGKAYRGAITAALAAIEACPQPVIAAVNGAAIGGGAEIALACDWRLATPTAQFAIPAVRFGITLAAVDVARVAALLGPGLAAEWLLRGKRLNAEEALNLGLVNAIVAPEELLPTTLNQAREVAGHAPLAVRWTKRVLQHWQQDPSLGGISAADREFPARSFSTADFREGTRALLDRRAPRFTGQ